MGRGLVWCLNYRNIGGDSWTLLHDERTVAQAVFLARSCYLDYRGSLAHAGNNFLAFSCSVLGAVDYLYIIFDPEDADYVNRLLSGTTEWLKTFREKFPENDWTGGKIREWGLLAVIDALECPDAFPEDIMASFPFGPRVVSTRIFKPHSGSPHAVPICLGGVLPPQE